MSKLHKIFITGSNRGLGKSLTELLFKNHPQAELHLSSRNEIQSSRQFWNKQLPNNTFHHYKLDLNVHNYLKETTTNLQNTSTKLSTIVANAAIGYDQFATKPPSAQIASQTLNTNTLSTIKFIKEMLPFLEDNGRIVIVSTVLGSLAAQGGEVRKILDDPSIGEEDIQRLVRDYVQAAVKGEMGIFKKSSFGLSKALINTWGRFILPKLLKKQQSCVVMYPGWCKTDFGGSKAQLSAEQGAKLMNECIWMKETSPNQFWNNKYCSFLKCI